MPRSTPVATFEKQVVDFLASNDEATGKPNLIWLKFREAPNFGTLSSKQPPRIVEFFRGQGGNKISVGPVILSSVQIEAGLWATARCDGVSEIAARYSKLPPPIPEFVEEIGRDRTVLIEVFVGCAKPVNENVQAVFLLNFLPPQVAAS